MSFATPLDESDNLAAAMPGALAALAEARLRVDAARRLAAAHKAGVADVNVAEWQLEQALRRIDKLRARIDWEESGDGRR